MGGMGSLYIGVSGLQANQNALNTTAHNMANIHTEGYVRQQAVLSDTLYNTIKNGAVSSQQIGSGSTVAQVRQVRHIFLDEKYRMEAGRASYYEVGYATYYEIESVLGTIGGDEFSSLNGLKEAFAELAKEPSDTSKQALLKQRSVAFLKDAKNVYGLLEKYQNNLNDQVVDTIGQINELANTIYELNNRIRSIESGGVENANDLRDARNTALDKLSGLIKISYSEDAKGSVSVSAEGVPLVGESYVYELGYTTDPVTGFATPTWPDYKDMQVFDMNARISSDTDTDVGKLKSLLLQRGTKTSIYTDIPIASNYQDSTGKWTTGSWTINGKTYTDGEKAYAAAAEDYDANITMSGMMNTLAQFDQLIHEVVTTINDLLCPNITMTVAAGETWKDANGNTLTPGGKYTVLDLENCARAADGSVGIELFSRGTTERYNKYTYTDAAGTERTCYVYNEEDPSKSSSLYTTENLTVNLSILNDVGKLPIYAKDGHENRDLAEKLEAAWSDKILALSPNATAKLTLVDYYAKLSVDVGNRGYMYNKISSKLGESVTGLDNNRQMVIGVSSDEELTNMIKYQNAYNACSRYINVVSDMLEHIITSLGKG